MRSSVSSFGAPFEVPFVVIVPAPEAASSGLPQFDFAWWPGQIVWFLVLFAIVFLLMRLVFVPRGWLLGTLGRWLGLDIYVEAVKGQERKVRCAA